MCIFTRMERIGQASGQKFTGRLFEGASFRGFDSTENSAEFVISDGSVDRYGTIIPINAWDLNNYNHNPLVMYQHAGHYSSDPDQIIGRGEVRVEGDKLIGKVFFEPAEVNEKAAKVAAKVDFGTLRATSVGFLPLEGGEYRKVKNHNGQDEEVYVYGKVDLLEFSIVNVPANPNAVGKFLGDLEPDLPMRADDGEGVALDEEERGYIEGDDKPGAEDVGKNLDNGLGLYNKRLFLRRKLYSIPGA